MTRQRPVSHRNAYLTTLRRMAENRPSMPSAQLPQGARIAIAAARWNEEIVQRLLDGCAQRLVELGVEAEVVRVPGAFELPLAARWLCGTGRYGAVICLGCVIRGETAHFEHVAGQCARGILEVSLQTQVPVIFGVLTTQSQEQALERSGGGHGHAGIAAAEAAVEMAVLREKIAGPAAG